MDGKVVIVTGATQGIGFATARKLYAKGAKVYFACRNEQKANICMKHLLESKQGGGGQAMFLHLDLDNPNGAKAAATEFMRLEDRLDLLINNAALTTVDYEMKNEWGVQRVVLVNYFSTRIFTESLLPIMKKTDNLPDSDVRIVNLSSSGHLFVPKSWTLREVKDLNLDFRNKYFASLYRYGLSKLLLNLWTFQLQSLLTHSELNVIVMAVHPGGVQTEGQTVASSRMTKLGGPLYRLIVRVAFPTVEKGIASTMFAATSPVVRYDAGKFRGAYLVPPGKIAAPSRRSRDPELAKKLQVLADEKIKEWGIAIDE